jgi:hypothetical protein
LELARGYQQKKDTDNAEKYFARFADLWRNADENLSFAKEASAKAYLAD